MPLRVRVVSIAGVKDKDDLGGNDLYVRVSADGSNWEQTSVKKGAGKQAVFDEAFTFPNYTPGGTIYVEVYDKDVGTDDKLGTAKITPELTGAGEQEVVAELSHGLLHSKKGVINLIVSAQ